MELSCGPIAPTLVLLIGWTSCAAQVANAGPDQYICGDTTILQGNLPGVGQTGTWSVFSGSATFADATYAGTQVTGLTFGDNELVWTLTDGVTTTTDTVRIVAYDPGAPLAWTMGDTAITGPPFTITLTASSPYYPQFCMWAVVAGTGTFSNMTYENTTVTDLGIGVNTFRWVCNNGPCGVSMWQLAVSVNTFSTVVLEGPTQAPFSIDPGNSHLLITSAWPVSDLRIMDAQGRALTTDGDLRAGLYIITARIGSKVYTQRFVVAR